MKRLLIAVVTSAFVLLVSGCGEEKKEAVAPAPPGAVGSEKVLKDGGMKTAPTN